MNYQFEFPIKETGKDKQGRSYELQSVRSFFKYTIASIKYKDDSKTFEMIFSGNQRTGWEYEGKREFEVDRYAFEDAVFNNFELKNFDYKLPTY